ncbi:MAG TPA: PQQ-binding-like beta-propeller repeat protein, partial [Candidatus Acidoferrum sp.]|nr:PQQ-binding-like beta-propeller repeat protein [Candidatus Acidoferrum sp.]
MLSSTAQESPAPATSAISQSSRDWLGYGGNSEGNHFSELAQINRANVTQLQVVWTFDTAEPGGLQTNPLIVNGVLYGITPTQKIFALDAATGKLLWKFDSG